MTPPEAGSNSGQAGPDVFGGRYETGLETNATAQQQPQQENNTQSDKRPAEGDVYLDGTLVGRWMEKQLARSAARPPVGSSAFDATRSRLPTGTMIGV
jgi:hypothetical protein